MYFKNVHPKFPDGGKLTQYLEQLPIGETIDVRGPSGLLVYTRPGVFSIKADKKSIPVDFQLNHLNMIAGMTCVRYLSKKLEFPMFYMLNNRWIWHYSYGMIFNIRIFS